MSPAPVIDVDSHVYEPPDIWERYVPAEYRSLAKSAFYHEVDEAGNRLTVLNGASAPDLNRHRLVRQAIWRPGLSIDARTGSIRARRATDTGAAGPRPTRVTDRQGKSG